MKDIKTKQKKNDKMKDMKKNFESLNMKEI